MKSNTPDNMDKMDNILKDNKKVIKIVLKLKNPPNLSSMNKKRRKTTSRSSKD